LTAAARDRTMVRMPLTPEQIADIADRTGQPPVEKAAPQDGAASPVLDPTALLARARTFAFCHGHIVVEPRVDWASEFALDPTQQVDFRGPVWVIANRRGVYLLGEDGQFHSKAPALRMTRDAALTRAAAIERCWTEANARAESNTPQPVVQGLCTKCGLDGCVPGAE
jgi:hypothetical protein